MSYSLMRIPYRKVIGHLFLQRNPHRIVRITESFPCRFHADFGAEYMQAFCTEIRSGNGANLELRLGVGLLLRLFAFALSAWGSGSSEKDTPIGGPNSADISFFMVCHCFLCVYFYILYAQLKQNKICNSFFKYHEALHNVLAAYDKSRLFFF